MRIPAHRTSDWENGAGASAELNMTGKLQNSCSDSFRKEKSCISDFRIPLRDFQDNVVIVDLFKLCFHVIQDASGIRHDQALELPVVVRVHSLPVLDVLCKVVEVFRFMR